MVSSMVAHSRLDNELELYGFRPQKVVRALLCQCDPYMLKSVQLQLINIEILKET